jgi:HlyD family secretion protein
MRYSLPILLLAAGPALAQPAATPAAPAPAVTVVRAAEREIVERAVVTGTVVPRDEILVAPEIEGFRIVELLAEEGDRVARGQVLARLNREMLDAQRAQNAAAVAKAEAGIAQARSQIIQGEAAFLEATQSLDRARLLMKSGNFTEAVLEQRVSLARSAEAKLAAAREGLTMAEAERAQAQALGREIDLRLARTEIRAPEAGIVSRRNARVGAAATAVGEPLFRLIARGEVELEGEVTETQLPRMRPGAAVTIELDGDRRVQGKVRIVYPEIDRATRLGKVRVALPADAGFRAGAFARGAIEIARRTGTAVPITSVVYAPGGGATVLAVAGDRVQLRRITTGLQAAGFIEVRNGVEAGEPVIARAGSFLRDGDRVRPILPAEANALAKP